MSNIISFNGISKHFAGVKALQDVSFTIERGETHAIVGENGAGKSTLMNILSGMYAQDSGEILLNGMPTVIGSPTRAISLGILTVYQELKLCLNLTAVENIFLGRLLHTRWGTNDWKSMRRQTQKYIDNFGIALDINIPVRQLSAAQMQIVEIVKALSKRIEVLILDEPTSSLTVSETDKLFEILSALREKGVTILFISHRLDEVFKIADRVTVLRDGKYLGTYPTSELTNDGVVRLIAGDKLFEEISHGRGETHELLRDKVALEVTNLTRGPRVRDISFRLYHGELLGIYGLQGAGRTELMETLFGLHHDYRGTISIDGKAVTLHSPRSAISSGLSFVTEDRKNFGVFGKLDVKDNIAVIHRKRISTLGVLRQRKIAGLANEYVQKLSIRVSGLTQNVLKLSGGNQQKVIIARSLSTRPQIMLLDEPTRGIDVGAKAEVFRILRELRSSENISIIVISSELKEIVSECDRILVMRNGRLSGEVTDLKGREENILHYAFNG